MFNCLRELTVRKTSEKWDSGVEKQKIKSLVCLFLTQYSGANHLDHLDSFPVLKDCDKMVIAIF